MDNCVCYNFGGLKYPLLGFIVPIVMLIGIIGGFMRGRFVAAGFVRAGAFYDRIVQYISPNKKIPIGFDIHCFVGVFLFY
jgi:hypothetical protein